MGSGFPEREVLALPGRGLLFQSGGLGQPSLVF